MRQIYHFISCLAGVVFLSGVIFSDLACAIMICNRCGERLLWNGKDNICVSEKCNKGSQNVTVEILDRYGDVDLLKLLSEEEQYEISASEVSNSESSLVSCLAAEKFGLTPDVLSEGLRNLEIMRRSLFCLYSVNKAKIRKQEENDKAYEYFVNFYRVLDEFAASKNVKLSEHVPEVLLEWSDFFLFSKGTLNIDDIEAPESSCSLRLKLQRNKKQTVVFKVRDRGYFLVTVKLRVLSESSRKVIVYAFNMKPVSLKPIQLTPVLSSLWNMAGKKQVVILHHN